MGDTVPEPFKPPRTAKERKRARAAAPLKKCPHCGAGPWRRNHLAQHVQNERGVTFAQAWAEIAPLYAPEHPAEPPKPAGGRGPSDRMETPPAAPTAPPLPPKPSTGFDLW